MMTIKMKRLVLACALMAGTTCAVASDFTDKTQAELALDFSNDQNPVNLTITQVQDVYAYEMLDHGTKLATVSLSTQSGQARRLAMNWGNNPSMTVDGMYATVNNGNPDDQPLILNLDTSPQGQSPTYITVGNESYLVFDNAAAVSADIRLVTTQEIAAGTYPVTVKAAVYNN